jgi:hypothetical protein
MWSPPALLLSLSGLALLGGCARPQRADPQPIAQRYLQLAVSGNSDGAFDLLDDQAQRRCDRSCFQKLLASQRGELALALAQLQAGEARVEYRSELHLADGSSLRLAQSGPPADKPSAGKLPATPYLFSDSPLNFYPQDSPLRTLRAFMRAVELRRYDVLVRFIPQSLEAQYREATLRQRFDGPGRSTLLGQLAAIQRHLGEPFTYDSQGQTAQLALGDGKEARLQLEDGRWRVVQLE